MSNIGSIRREARLVRLPPCISLGIELMSEIVLNTGGGGLEVCQIQKEIWIAPDHGEEVA